MLAVEAPGCIDAYSLTAFLLDQQHVVEIDCYGIRKYIFLADFA